MQVLVTIGSDFTSEMVRDVIVNHKAQQCKTKQFRNYFRHIIEDCSKLKSRNCNLEVYSCIGRCKTAGNQSEGALCDPNLMKINETHLCCRALQG